MQVKNYEVVMENIKQETRDVKTFTLRFNENFEFKPGHFIMLKHIHENKIRSKPYSIASSPKIKDKIDLCLDIIPGGITSNYLFSLKGNEKLEISGPYGVFLLKEPYDYDFVFIATGTGVAPFRSMINYLLENNIKKEIWLFFGNKKREDIIYDKEWQELESKYKNFHYIPILSREEWEGEKGYVQDIIPRHVKDYNNKHFYICGLMAMVQDVKRFLLGQGVKPEQIHHEIYV